MSTQQMPAHAAPAGALERRLRAAIPGLNADEPLVRRGRFLTADILLGLGPDTFILAIREGCIAGMETATRLMRPWVFAVRASAADWQAHWQDPPPPGWHDLLAMAKRGAATIEGDLHPFMANLQYVKDVLAAPRRLT